MRKLALALTFLLSFMATAHAVDPGEKLADPVLEARARTISKELRCLVCQNQSIDDSDADLAHDLRQLVRDRLTAGDSNAQVLDYIVARYGQFVLLRPPFEAVTVLLWLTPFAIIVFGAGGLWFTFRRRAAQNSIQALDSEEKSRISEILGEDNSAR